MRSHTDQRPQPFGLRSIAPKKPADFLPCAKVSRAACGRKRKTRLYDRHRSSFTSGRLCDHRRIDPSFDNYLFLASGWVKDDSYRHPEREGRQSYQREQQHASVCGYSQRAPATTQPRTARVLITSCYIAPTALVTGRSASARGGTHNCEPLPQ